MASKLMYEVSKSESGASYLWTCRLCGEQSAGWDWRGNAVGMARQHVAEKHPLTSRLPKASTFTDGGGLVIGTGDLDVARKFMQAHLLEEYGAKELADYPEMDFTDMEPMFDVGQMVPAQPDSEYSWFWKGHLKEEMLGRRGVTRAVVWLL